MKTDISRRELLAMAAAAPLLQGAATLDRKAIVDRHAPRYHGIDPRSPLSVGNGEFAFTADITGLQSLADAYEKEVPLCTQSQWGWHTTPIPAGLDPDKLRPEAFDTYGRIVNYWTDSKGQEPLFNWLRQNPHRLNLARIGLVLDEKPLNPQDISGIDQRLDLWSGTLESKFSLQGTQVIVSTVCHPQRDGIAVIVKTKGKLQKRLAIAFEFPYGSPAMNGSDWSGDSLHRTEVGGSTANSVSLDRLLDEDSYAVRIVWEGKAEAAKKGAHRVLLAGDELSFTCEFTPGSASQRPLAVGPTFSAAAVHWARFWQSGGALDFSTSMDKRAGELERRVVLSQYLTAIQCSGSMPPQETGLTCNSWFGKFHLEMHWWHAAHFPLWGRTPLLERSLGWYGLILPGARAKAQMQGYAGARWPKMTSREGHDSPSPIGELLIWQQPHPIFFAALCYRAHPDASTLQRYARIIQESAEFMASFAVERNGRYVLGPPVIPVQENHPPRETWNPTFELAYWRQGLFIAQAWREKLGQPRVPQWDEVLRKLSPLPSKDGVYLAHENCPQTYTERNRDHPSMLAAYGMLAGDGVDKETMRRTLKKVLVEWKWEDTWGWDFPMTAMTAAKLGEPELAVNALFIESPKNTWLANGHNWQRANLPCYLPGNGGLLTAVAMMATAWQGFPKDNWSVKAEGLQPML